MIPYCRITPRLLLRGKKLVRVSPLAACRPERSRRTSFPVTRLEVPPTFIGHPESAGEGSRSPDPLAQGRLPFCHHL
jgi:hypothetical protein